MTGTELPCRTLTVRRDAYRAGESRDSPADITCVSTIFPGTANTPDRVLVFVLPLAAVVCAAGWAAPRPGDQQSASVVLLTMVAAPISHVLFGLTASLTPDMFATVIRTQTFAHVPAVVVAATAAVGVAAR